MTSLQTRNRLLYLLTISFSFTLSILSATPSCWSQTDLLNESFEEGSKVPDGWRSGANIPGVEYLYDKSSGSDGKRSLALKKTAQRYFPIAQWFHALKCDGSTTEVALNAKVKAVDATKATIELQFLDASEQVIGKEWVVYIGQKENADPKANHDWKDYRGQTAVPKGTKQIVVALQIYGPGSVWFDEVRLRVLGGKEDLALSIGDTSGLNPAAASRANSNTPESLKTESGAWTRWVWIPPDAANTKPTAGYPLVVVLAGGDGSIAFHPFIKSIHSQALEGKCAVAHIIAPPQIVWPTNQSRSRYATTEEAVVAIVEQASQRVAIDKTKIIALAWSSSGPAIYESMLHGNTPLSGAVIAMSVFHAKDYNSLESIRGRRIYLLHSPEDQVCPFAMAEEARDKLSSAGGQTKLVSYSGGHGWHGPVFDNIRTAASWVFDDK